ncbi:proline--tRNA ligase [Bacillaceae bacterium SIJ1]|uniref:proline--tRNA ligase n=1 Tax=Litoribacterium kuwaitense TaxID=1398745 RepID=UPI0013EDDCB8|nr:proline--tRNA ligase [Litoribacterium kuwaitense]NGP44094.1 proline--tRNA ligase [Litoribacterium kuwaitense]
MRQSNTHIPTLRDVPADAEVRSHQLLVRAGYIRQSAAGIYSFLPLGLRVLSRVKEIVREEMEAAGLSEILMPALQLSDLWKESGRWSVYGPELMRLEDRHQREFALGATHEEMITSLLRDEVNSYKQLPLGLFQIQTKFRDEKRPRFGLLRGREFLMKDAYTFHLTNESLDEFYQRIFTAYENVFTRCGMNFRAVLADSGAMGGTDNHEFMALSEIGEDTIAYSDESNYAANIEMAALPKLEKPEIGEPKELAKVETPVQKTIADVASFLNVTAAQCMKSLLVKADDELVLVVLRGDHELNETKLKNVLQVEDITLATDDEAREALGTGHGFIGPVGVSSLRIIADQAVAELDDAVCGANEAGYHYTGVHAIRDIAPFSEEHYADIRNIQEGDPSPDGRGKIVFARGIEVGHVFKLGKKYSEAMDATILDQNGKSQHIIMGSYGIGVSRLLAAVAEQQADEKGLLWPETIAPYDVHLLVMNPKDEEQHSLAEKLYQEMKETGTSVLYDDRKERAGVKFADADLIGIPTRIIVGKQAAEGKIEFSKGREPKEVLTVEEALAAVRS